MPLPKTEVIDISDEESYPYLAALNAAQLKAVTAPPEIPLQILAGPGSGKTRVLTSRVAHLVRHHGYNPYQITAVTFTNKSAAEMRKRLHKLLGPKAAEELVLGTFHATCARYLRRYGKRIGLESNYAIADADDCKKIMQRLLKDRSKQLEEMHISLKEGAVLSEISKAKAKEESPEAMAVRAANDPDQSTSTLAVIADLYLDYEAALHDAGALDFDDLLVYGVRLFRQEPGILATCKHILVDEFQDTNTTQYELLKCFARSHNGVSIVGDPDQSIYGWRSAEVENLNKMKDDFRGVDIILLEENYRSTGAILAASHSIVSQDPQRIPKSLFTSHPKSTPATLKQFVSPLLEGSYISTEIKRLIAYSGGILGYDDFAILLRYNALSRVIESALQKDGIPNRIVGGHKFFERMEIKDLLAYLQLADNPNFTPAFMRVVNVPKRAIGDKSVADIVTAAKKANLQPMEMAERITDGDKVPAGIKPAVKRNLSAFVSVVRKLRRAAVKGSSVADLIRLAIEKTNYEEYLRTSQQDFDQRWENVQELISYSVLVNEEQVRQSTAEAQNPGFISGNLAPMEPEQKPKLDPDAPLHHIFRGATAGSRSRSSSATSDMRSKVSKPRVKIEDDIVEILSSEEEQEEPEPVEVKPPVADQSGELMTPLRYFLQTSMLSTDTESNDEDKHIPRVTISTVHAAKGLEWPVVFIPSVENGTFPFYRCTEPQEVAEERRLLYVAMTRAQSFLTLTYVATRMMGGEENEREVSSFVASSLRKDPTIFSTSLPHVDVHVRQQLAAMLDRPLPNEDEMKDMIMKHVRAAPPLSTWDAPVSRGSHYSRFGRNDGRGRSAAGNEYWESDVDDYALPDSPGSAAASSGRPGFLAFSSARSHVDQARAVPKPPVPRLQSANRNLPPAVPFTFETKPTPQTGSTLSSFTSGSSSSLAMMKSLGLPEEKPATSATGLGTFTSGSSSSLAMMKSLGLPEAKPAAAPFRPPVATSNVGAGQQQTTGSGVPLARGTKRLGMGRPAPWGTKKPRN